MPVGRSTPCGGRRHPQAGRPAVVVGSVGDGGGRLAAPRRARPPKTGRQRLLPDELVGPLVNARRTAAQLQAPTAAGDGGRPVSSLLQRDPGQDRDASAVERPSSFGPPAGTHPHHPPVDTCRPRSSVAPPLRGGA